MKHNMSFPAGPRQGPHADADFSEALREALAFLRANLGKMFVVGLLCAVMALVAASQMDRLYKSSTQLMIERPVVSPIENERAAVAQIDPGYVDGQILLLSSPDMLRRVVERADLLAEPWFQPKPPTLVRRAINAVKALVPGQPNVALPQGMVVDREMLSAISTLEEALTIVREGETNVVSINVRLPSPVLAQRIASTLAQVYIDDRFAQRDAEAKRLSDWIDERAAELLVQLSEAERAATSYRIENDLIGKTDAGAGLSEQQLTELNAELIRSRADLAQTRAAYEQAQQVLQTGDPGGLPRVQASPIIVTLRQTQMELQRLLEDASKLGTLNAPRVQQIERQLAAVESQLQAEISRIAKGLEYETQALESRTRLLAEALDNAGGASGNETMSAVQLRELERLVEAYQLRYERYLNSEGLANELRTFAASGVQVVSAASLPLEPFYPPTKVLVILGFLFGAFLVLVSALARNALQRGFNSLDEIESALGLRVLSVLPQLPKGQSGADLVRLQPYSMFSEAISVLRQNLSMVGETDAGRRRGQVILITSAEEDVGKTTVAASLAESATASGKRVLVIDADLRFAGLSAHYQMEDSLGLCDILRGNKFLPDVDDTPGEGVLGVVPAGSLRGQQPASYLESPHLRAFLNFAATRYDLVVVDGSPVANLADCRILARECSAVAVVLHAKKTSRDSIRSAIRQLPLQKIAGLVVTGTDPRDTSGRWTQGGVYTAGYIHPNLPLAGNAIPPARTPARGAIDMGQPV